MMVAYLQPAEIRMTQANNDAANSAILDQKIRAAAQHREWQLVLGAELEQPGQIRFRGWFHIKIGPPTNAQGGPARERFILLEKRFSRQTSPQRPIKLLFGLHQFLF